MYEWCIGEKCEHKDKCQVRHFVFDEEKEQASTPEGECDTVGTQAAAEKVAEEQDEPKKSEE